MIQKGTIIKITDNSGAKLIKCIQALGGSKRRYAQLGDVVVGSVIKAEPRKLVKKHQVVRAVIVRQKKKYRRKDGSYISFDDNAAVILGENEESKGGRIFGPVAKEIREKDFGKIAGLAKDIV